MPMLFILGGKQIVKQSTSAFFIKLKQSSACYHYFWIHPLVVTITLNFCMLSLHNLTIFFRMHVRYCTQSCWTCREKEKSFARQYNVMQILLHGGSMENPPHPLQIVIQRKISVLRRIQTPLTTPIYPPRCLLYLGMVMLVISCICCLAVPTFDIIYVICLV